MLACVALAGAFVAGYLSGAADQSTLASPRVDMFHDRGEVSVDVAGVRAEIDAALSRRLGPLLAELAALRAAGAATDLEIVEPASAALVEQNGGFSNSPQFATARAFVDERLAYGTWTEAARETLRTTMLGLSDSEADQVLSALFGAMNDGRIEIRMDGPPL